MINIDVTDRNQIDGQIQDLIKEIADVYYDGEIEDAVLYLKLMGECIEED
jgi:hypothetical protein